jgi:SH3 domain-containing YSC84-like protein 1
MRKVYSLGAGLMLALLAALMVCSTIFATSAYAGPSEEQLLVDQAALTLDNFQKDDNMGWYRDLLGDADGVLIVPDLFKAGLLIGGSGGKGVLFTRDEGAGVWHGPIFYNMGSVTGGIQIGGQLSEVVFLIMTKEGVESMYAPSVKLGTDVSIAAGPVGAGAEGATTHNPQAAFLSFMRTKGAYVGLTLEGTVITVDDGSNARYYGRSVRPIDIILGRVSSAAGGDGLRSDLARDAAKKQE